MSYTTIRIKDEEKHKDLKHVANKAGYNSFSDFVWSALLDFSKRQDVQVSNLGKWFGEHTKVMPRDVYDTPSWKEYVKDMDKDECRKLHTAIGKIFDITDNKLIRR